MADKTTKTWKDRQAFAGLFTPLGDGGISLIRGGRSRRDRASRSSLPTALAALAVGSRAGPDISSMAVWFHNGEKRLTRLCWSALSRGRRSGGSSIATGALWRRKRVLRALAECGATVASAEALAGRCASGSGGLDAARVAAGCGDSPESHLAGGRHAARPVRRGHCRSRWASASDGSSPAPRARRPSALERLLANRSLRVRARGSPARGGGRPAQCGQGPRS